MVVVLGSVNDLLKAYGTYWLLVTGRITPLLISLTGSYRLPPL